jgi:zinc protease
LFHLRAEARTGHTAEEVEATLYDELDKIVSDGVTTRELDRAKHQVEAHFVLSRERTLDQAVLLGQMETLNGLDYIDTFVQRISTITAADVASACARYLTETNRTVGHLVPDGLDSDNGDSEGDFEGDGDAGP